MWFDRFMSFGGFSRGNLNNRNGDVKKAFQPHNGKVKVGILGTGKIGTDLLIKALRSEHLECVIFAGRNMQSDGMQHAASLGVTTSDKGIDAFVSNPYGCDIVFDATSAAYHVEHAKVFEQQGIFAIDMTPSQIGECVVPAISLLEVKNNCNISMISCGGQSSIPIAYALSIALPNIEMLRVESRVSANSIGPGTIANIEEYYRNTKAGLNKYTGVEDIEVDLFVDEVNLESKMYTDIYAKTDRCGADLFWGALQDMLARIQKYVPGYAIEGQPVYANGFVKVQISVEGCGDYLPKYAGNLDIINCAAIAVAEEHSMNMRTESQNLYVEAS